MNYTVDVHNRPFFVCECTIIEFERKRTVSFRGVSGRRRAQNNKNAVHSTALFTHGPWLLRTHANRHVSHCPSLLTFHYGLIGKPRVLGDLESAVV